jgi:CBS domain-containing protein
MNQTTECYIQGGDEMIFCRQIMTPDPAVCDPATTTDVIARMMRDNDVGPVPVVDSVENKVLVGLITDRDLAITVVADNKKPSEITANEVMSKVPISCSADAEIEELLDLMETLQLRRIPIVDPDNRIIGIVSQKDIANRLNWPDKTSELLEQVSKSPQDA